MKNLNYKHILQRLKRSNIKAFLFFLLLSVVVWILVQFAEDYSKNVAFKINFINVPKDKLVVNSDKVLEVEIRTSGFKILGLELLTPKLEIDLSTLDTLNSQFVLPLEENRTAITKRLNISEVSSRFLEDSIIIAYEQKAVKKVPVLGTLQITYAPGFSNLDSLRVKPDSITISGPKDVLDTIKKLKTKAIELKEVKSSLSGQVALDTVNYENVTFYTTKLTYSQKVDKFTEGKLFVPVTLINVPSNINVTVFPHEVAVIYQASLHNFDAIEANNFKVTEDFNELDRSLDYFIPKITKKPMEALNARLSSSKIQYIIKQ